MDQFTTSRDLQRLHKLIGALPIEVIVRNRKNSFSLSVLVKDLELRCNSSIVGVRDQIMQDCIFGEFKIGKFLVSRLVCGNFDRVIHYNVLPVKVLWFVSVEIEADFRNVGG